MVTRQYDVQLGKLLKQFPAVCLLGPRQSGKTTAAKNFLKTYKGKSIYLDLESYSDLQKLDNPEYYLDQFRDYLVVIDEVQFLPSLFPLLRHLIDDQLKPGRFLLLGSAEPSLIQGASESLAGRIAYIDTHPFNILELKKASKKPIEINKHWIKGGFPKAWLCKTENQWNNWMDAFTRTFIERDMNKLFGVNFTPSLMRSIWQMLAHLNGQKWNAQHFAKGLDVSPTTINRYIDYLEGAYMIRKLPPYFGNTRKMLVKSPKVYIRDSGILHHFLHISNKKHLINHPAIGFSWEGYVIEQILQQVNRQYNACFYATADGSEMDLVLVRGIQPMACIEIKTSPEAKITRGTYESIKDLGTSQNFVINSSIHEDYKNSEGIIFCSLEVFLVKYLNKI